MEIAVPPGVTGITSIVIDGREGGGRPDMHHRAPDAGRALHLRDWR
jgi:hypothetical protein